MRTLAVLAALVVAAAAAVVAAPPALAEPGTATVVPIQVTGDPAKRFNLVVMGDGYPAPRGPTGSCSRSATATRTAARAARTPPRLAATRCPR